MTAVTARSDSSLRQVHSVSLLKLLLFSQETGSCPLPAQRITSCRLSDGGRLFVLERLPPKQKPGLINDKREKDKLCVNVCVRLGRLRSGQIPDRAGTRSLITSGSGFTSTLHLLWPKGQWASITGCCEAMIGCWRVWGESPTCPHGSCPWLQTVSSATYRGRGGERKHETKRVKLK